MERITTAVSGGINSIDRGKLEYGLAAAVGIGALAGLAYFAIGPSFSSYKRKPSTLELSGGTIDKKEIKAKFDDYKQSYGTEAGEGIKESERGRTAQLVDTFYNLVTDIYEWGWGPSFHFSPRLPGKSRLISEAVHEARIPALLRLQPGMRCLDVGCGVGGPMRTVASTSGCEVTGITINDYQVMRASYHNEKLGVDGLCKPVQGNFLAMPFPDNSFDGAYAIEATCHAPKLEDVYGEVYRILRPGSCFASYEWVATKNFDPNNAEHVRIMDAINYGNGLPEMRTYKQAEQAGKAVGFNLVMSYDIATASSVAGPWYERLAFLRKGYIINVNKFLVDVTSFLGLAPKGMKEVHDMLVDVAQSLVEGGELGIFSPMHLLLFQKPLDASSEAPKRAPAAAAAEAPSAPQNATPALSKKAQDPPPPTPAPKEPEKAAIAPKETEKTAAGSGLSADAAPFDPMGKSGVGGKGKKAGSGKPSAAAPPAKAATPVLN